MRYLSLFSGIESCSVAFEPLGWECAAVSEIEPFPCEVLKYRYPNTPNLGDVTKITELDIRALGHIDAVFFGAPCQDLSVANNVRKGLKNADGSLTRSGLFFTACEIAEWANPRWTVWENVPGAFSSQGGGDFAAVVRELSGAEIGVPEDGWANSGVALGRKGLVEWVVLDAQFVRTQCHPRAVPQRRRRVFVIRDSGDWASRAPLFLEPAGLCGNPPPSRESGQRVAGTISSRTQGGGGLGTDFECAGGVIEIPEVCGCLSDGAHNGGGLTDRTPTPGESFQPPYHCEKCGKENGESWFKMCRWCGALQSDPAPQLSCREVAQALTSNYGKQPDNSDTAQGPNLIAFSCKDHGADATKEVAPTLRSMNHSESHANGGGQLPIAFDTTQITSPENGCNPKPGDPCHPLAAGAHPPAIATRMAVRRLLPVECERLMGLPDGWTDIPIKGKRAKDGPRYKALGNSMATNVMRLIGERIQAASKNSS